MLSCEGIGKTIEKAIEDALFQLKAPREDVDIKIIEEGGLFKKAKVLVSISEDCCQKYEDKKLKREEIEKEEKNNQIKEEKFQSKPELVKTKIETEKKLDENETVCDEKNCPCENNDACKCESHCECEEYEQIDAEEVKATKLLKGIMERLGIEGKVVASKSNDKIKLIVNGENTSEIIGYRGEALNAIQYLLNVYQSKGDREADRILLDCQNYREKREETLVNLASRMARKVAKTHHQVKLEPMNANERRIIHTALQNDSYVTTYSKGNEPNRFLIIAPKNK